MNDIDTIRKSILLNGNLANQVKLHADRLSAINFRYISFCEAIRDLIERGITSLSWTDYDANSLRRPR